MLGRPICTRRVRPRQKYNKEVAGVRFGLKADKQLGRRTGRAKTDVPAAC